MKFEDIGTKELKELNLFPIKGINNLKTILNYGYYEIYVYNNTEKKRIEYTYRPYLDSFGRMHTDAPNPKFWSLMHRIEVHDLYSIPDEDLPIITTRSRNITPTVCKIIWLKKYLKGEESGVYSKIKDDKLSVFDKLTESSQQEEEIRSLKVKVFELQEENRQLKEIIKQQKAEISKTIKTKEKMSKIFNLLETCKDELN